MSSPPEAIAIADEFGLGPVRAWEAVGADGRGVARLTTGAGRFIVKPVGDPRWLPLYAEVERRLNAAGVCQAGLWARPDGTWASSTGHAVYEQLPGETAQTLTPARLRSAVAYLARYLRALADVPVPEWLRGPEDDPWRQAASAEVLTEDVASRLDDLPIPADALPVARRALDELAAYRDLLEADACQLVHGDVGPGNVLFEGDEVVAVIDFTPLWAAELYALCQFLYWHFLAFADAAPDVEGIGRALRLYRAARPSLDPSPAAFQGAIVLAAAYRLFGPVLATAAGRSAYSEAALLRRTSLLAATLDTAFERGP